MFRYVFIGDDDSQLVEDNNIFKVICLRKRVCLEKGKT